MPAPRVDDEQILERLSEVFQLHGYEVASLSLLSATTGLQRASLYHRFPGGKAEMAEAWIAARRDLAIEAGFEPDTARQRAEDAFIRIQGSLALARTTGDTVAFEHHRLLQLSGRAEVVPLTAAPAPEGRSWRFESEQWIEGELSPLYDWSRPEYSRFNPGIDSP